MVEVMDSYHDPDSGQYGLSYPFDPYFTSAFLQGFGGYYFDPAADPRLGVDLDETVQGLEFALENLTPYMPNDPTYEPPGRRVRGGQRRLRHQRPWYLATLNDKGVNYEVTSLPAVDGGELRPYTGISMWYFADAMSDGGADATAGREFVEWYVTNEEMHLENAEEHGAIPVLDSLVGSDDLPENVQAYSETVGKGVPDADRPQDEQGVGTDGDGAHRRVQRRRHGRGGTDHGRNRYPRQLGVRDTQWYGITRRSPRRGSAVPRQA